MRKAAIDAGSSAVRLPCATVSPGSCWLCAGISGVGDCAAAGLPAAAAVAAKASESADLRLKSVIAISYCCARTLWSQDRTLETWPEPGVDTGVLHHVTRVQASKKIAGNVGTRISDSSSDLKRPKP